VSKDHYHLIIASRRFLLLALFQNHSKVWRTRTPDYVISKESKEKGDQKRTQIPSVNSLKSSSPVLKLLKRSTMCDRGSIVGGLLKWLEYIRCNFDC